ncbi:iron chaperone [Rummeliibacillus pycnus]|uniref:iron chaperone n=1 Tax=Rummeliibacillus pycnus TaxID=101070 RepID=UPI000C9B4E22|nr:DUF1801 domain-containing protein [Rummeliibacillus pycnus]
MEKSKISYNTVDEYIAQFPTDVQEKLQMLRKIIKDAVPNVGEKISYQMPTFTFRGNLVYFAAYKKHIGFYPTSSGINAYKDELQQYKMGKGSVQFPIDEPLPFELIRKIVQFRVAENIKKMKTSS